jgi:hypothetical protein
MVVAGWWCAQQKQQQYKHLRSAVVQASLLNIYALPVAYLVILFL